MKQTEEERKIEEERKNIIFFKEKSESVRLFLKRFRRFWKNPFARYGGLLFIFFFIVSVYFLNGLYSPTPLDLKDGVLLEIPEGSSVKDIADILYEKKIIRSSFFFIIYARFDNAENILQAGTYYIKEPHSIKSIMERLKEGDFGMDAFVITIPEGMTTYQMVGLFERRLPEFEREVFMTLAEEKEGYLFPDTYRFSPFSTAEEVVMTLERNFYEKLSLLEEEISSSSLPVHQIITLASLLEREAFSFEERRIIAGILLERLRIDMPLQVDAVFGYIERRETFHPSFSTLKIDSPYNTYLYKGLPPGPIGSPSFDALRATLSPIETGDLYYLHGRDGILRTADTFEKHKENRRLYLD
jgi:UPF0755 protein